jgi:hypothetical protein
MPLRGLDSIYCSGASTPHSRAVTSAGIYSIEMIGPIFTLAIGLTVIGFLLAVQQKRAAMPNITKNFQNITVPLFNWSVYYRN